jgi:hypothetical protein
MPFKRSPYVRPSYLLVSLTSACAVDLLTYLEEESDDEHLQCPHAYNESDLNHTKVDNALLGALNGAEVSVLTGAEVLLVSRNGGELPRDFKNGLFKD